MKTIIDARNRACPMPIMMTKKAVDTATPGTEIDILINSESAKNNTVSFLKGNNIPVTWKQEGELFTLSVIKPEEAATTTDIPENACSTGCNL